MWATGLIAGAATLLPNLLLIRLTDGMVWHSTILLSAIVPDLILSVLAAWTGSPTAAALKGSTYPEVRV
jgi:hypothetical protein